MKSRSKYNARRTTVDNIQFDSAKEARRWSELRLLLKAGKIARLERQRAFPLWAPCRTNLRGEVDWDAPGVVKVGEYVADFCYDELTTKATVFVIEDVKGFKTPLYKWKKRHVEAQYEIQIREV